MTYHSLNGVTLRPGDGNASTALGGIVPGSAREGSAEETAGQGVAGERAGSTRDVAAVEGGFSGAGARG